MKDKGFMKSIFVLLFLTLICLQPINCKAAGTVSKIEILTEPKLKEYCVGDTFDSRGLSLMVTYSSGDTSIVATGYLTEYDFSTTGNQQVTIKYTEGGETASTEYTVKVYDKPSIKTDAAISTIQGNTFTIPVSIADNCGIMGFQLRVEYDKDCFTPIAVNNADIFEDGEVNDSIDTSLTNTFDIIWTGTENFNKNGKLFDIEFLCNNQAEVGDSSISISSVKNGTYNENYSNISCNTATGVVTIAGKDESSKEKLDNLAVFIDNWKEGEDMPEPVITGNVGNGAVSYLFAENAEGPYDTVCPTEPGKYYLKVVVKSTDMYQTGSAICSFSIQSASGDNDNDNNTGDNNTGDNNTGDNNVGDNNTGDNNTGDNNVGDNNIGNNSTGDNNTGGGNGNGQNESKGKKQLENVAVYMENWEYGKSASTPQLVGNIGKGKVTYYYASNINGPYTTQKPSAVGNYYLKAVISETTEYYGAVTTCSFKITEKSSVQTTTKVNLATPAIKSVKNVKGKKVKFTLKKKIANATGYEIQYSTKKSMKSSKKVKLSSSSKTSTTIKKLKLEKTYYFRVRAYRTENGNVSYSKWSSKKRTKIRK